MVRSDPMKRRTILTLDEECIRLKSLVDNKTKTTTRYENLHRTKDCTNYRNSLQEKWESKLTREPKGRDNGVGTWWAHAVVEDVSEAAKAIGGGGKVHGWSRKMKHARWI